MNDAVMAVVVNIKTDEISQVDGKPKHVSDC